MKAENFRLSNLIYSEESDIDNGQMIKKAVPVDMNILFELQRGNICKRYSEILLTEEWLLKAGFKKINHIYGYSFYSLKKLHIDIYENMTHYMGYKVNHCQYVHQLQDLYRVLTGTELDFVL